MVRDTASYLVEYVKGCDFCKLETGVLFSSFVGTGYASITFDIKDLTIILVPLNKPPERLTFRSSMIGDPTFSSSSCGRKPGNFMVLRKDTEEDEEDKLTAFARISVSDEEGQHTGFWKVSERFEECNVKTIDVRPSLSHGKLVDHAAKYKMMKLRRSYRMMAGFIADNGGVIWFHAALLVMYPEPVEEDLNLFLACFWTKSSELCDLCILVNQASRPKTKDFPPTVVNDFARVDIEDQIPLLAVIVFLVRRILWYLGKSKADICSAKLKKHLVESTDGTEGWLQVTLQKQSKLARKVLAIGLIHLTTGGRGGNHDSEFLEDNTLIVQGIGLMECDPVAFDSAVRITVAFDSCCLLLVICSGNLADSSQPDRSTIIVLCLLFLSQFEPPVMLTHLRLPAYGLLHMQEEMQQFSSAKIEEEVYVIRLKALKILLPKDVYRVVAFEMSAMGDDELLLRSTGEQLPDGIFISQEKVVNDHANIAKSRILVAILSTKGEYVAAASDCANRFLDSEPVAGLWFSTYGYQNTHWTTREHLHCEDPVFHRGFDGPRFAYLVVLLGWWKSLFRGLMESLLLGRRMVLPGCTMVLLVVIVPAGCFVSAGSYGLCCCYLFLMFSTSFRLLEFDIAGRLVSATSHLVSAGSIQSCGGNTVSAALNRLFVGQHINFAVFDLVFAISFFLKLVTAGCPLYLTKDRSQQKIGLLWGGKEFYEASQYPQYVDPSSLRR
ncbi:hypothetical protein Tco_0482259 [Tanacetum coccineum]